MRLVMRFFLASSAPFQDRSIRRPPVAPVGQQAIVASTCQSPWEACPVASKSVWLSPLPSSLGGVGGVNSISRQISRQSAPGSEELGESSEPQESEKLIEIAPLHITEGLSSYPARTLTHYGKTRRKHNEAPEVTPESTPAIELLGEVWDSLGDELKDKVCRLTRNPQRNL